MRIDEISLREIEFPLVAPFRAAAGDMHVRRTILVGVRAGDVRGVGELAALPDPTYTSETLRGERDVLVRYVIPAVLGLAAATVARVEREVAFVRGHRMAKAAMSLAVADATAMQRGESLAAGWGGGRDVVAAGIVLGFHDGIDGLLGQVSRARSHGYRRVKLKIRPGHDLESLREVRRAFPDLDLAADANGAYRLDEGPWAELDELGLSFVEEPLPPSSWSDLVALRKRLTTPICLDESVDGERSARVAIELGTVDVMNVKIPRVGGVGPAIAIHDLSRASGVDGFVGGMLDSCVGRFHQLALASLPGFTLPGDIGGTDRYTDVDLVSPPLRLGPTGIAVPDAAGVASRLDGDALDRATLRLDRFPAS